MCCDGKPQGAIRENGSGANSDQGDIYAETSRSQELAKGEAGVGDEGNSMCKGPPGRKEVGAGEGDKAGCGGSNADAPKVLSVCVCGGVGGGGAT